MESLKSHETGSRQAVLPSVTGSLHQTSAGSGILTELGEGV
jgi:hypothetical protein